MAADDPRRDDAERNAHRHTERGGASQQDDRECDERSARRGLCRAWPDVSEKSAAFGAAGVSLSRDWLAMQRDWNAQMADLSAMMLGRVPWPRKAMAMAARGQRMGSAALASSMRAMTPIHRAATANEKRLARGKR